MPSFTHSQLRFFNASDGAGSPVTKTEFGDSQVTLDKDEKRVLFSKIPESAVPRGSVKFTSAKKFPFKVFNKRMNSLLHVNFPKPKKNELRLYLSSREGFKPSIGDYWFIFKENTSDDIVVGYVDEKRWKLSQNKSLGALSKKVPLAPSVDLRDEKYQQDIYDPTPKSSSTVVSHQTKRDANLARKALANAHYCCEIDPRHKTFTSIRGTNYVEAHHLIPISATKELSVNLDFLENIVSLCPNCHRAIHHAALEERKYFVEHLFSKREKLIASRGINLSLAEICRFYGV